MKLPLLLAQYLYQFRQLSLPGIGTFQLEGQITEDKNAPSGSIRFTPGSAKSFEPELVDFVRTHTGKMRTLAEADLDSYLIDIKEFINIGKPCILEGIGTLTKNRDGSFEFSQGTPAPVRIEEVKTTLVEKPVDIHENEYYSETPSRSTMRTLLVGIAIIAGIGLIGWGGYYFYKRYEAQTQNLALSGNNNTTANSTALPPDSMADLTPDSMTVTTVTSSGDTLLQGGAAPSAASSSSEWKFVIRTAPKAAAEKRYQQLKSYGIPVEIQAVDTATSIVFLKLAVLPADTTRVKDSLRVYYASPVRIIR